MRQNYLFILLLLFTISCKGISQKHPRESQKIENVKGQVQLTHKLSPMEEQLIRDYYEIDDPEGIIVQPNDMQEKCTDLAVRLICQELIRSGFKPLPSQEAYKRVYQIFGVDLNQRPEELIQDGFWKYADKGNSKERSIQKNIMALKAVPDGQTFGIFWDLQTFVPQYNRELFLKYGYDKSDIINKMMIDEVKEEGELPIGKDYKELFVSKGADGRLLIHQGLLQYMLKHADRKNLYYCMLDQYLSYLLDMENEPEIDNLTKEERYKAGAYIGYYYGLMYEKCIGTPCDIQAFGYRLYYQKDFVSYIKKNNYFHLKDFDKIIQRQYDRYQEGVEIESHRMSGE